MTSEAPNSLSELSSEAILADGTVVAIRAITPGDGPRLVEFHEQLSFDTIYHRFFGVHPHLGPAETQHFCVVDGTQRVALVAVVGADIVGVARMERIEEGPTAEVAFVVADRFQHRGLGCLLAQRLAARAESLGVRDFLAYTMPENRPMRRLLSDAGFDVSTTMDDGIIVLSCCIVGGRAEPAADAVPIT